MDRYNNGVVVSYGNTQELENALLHLSDPVKRKAAGINSRRAYDEEYGWNKMKDKLTAIYKEVISIS